ncbi:hypothetical protein PFICI_05749 [Pestalotiopsis fici W106-1]|uniref:MalT-like TPR region domain-containing protein n=1 Tax=Pestalotiopsis fici (strain W106-1 / CGMCC3.15140) TaxID=1229662 RepID=W3XCP7_PESFW|nr:uncharacterized protein PFICI_05749 [Pestalotiopsis fici W106-1]ETS83873.1 hypothetical protein PFICI_05749 [Pestalotiopsis fici W106-1]
MGTCLCTSIHRLAETFDEDRAKELIPALNSHLQHLVAVLGQSRALCREVQYRITPSNQRTNKVFSVESVDLTPVDQVCERFRGDVDGFWTVFDDDAVHAELRRRLACVVIFLRSRLSAQASVPPPIAKLFVGQPNYTNIRNSGRKYIQLARRLGGLGAIFWFPLNIPHSTYERYLNVDDGELFSHFLSLRPQFKHYTGFVQRSILCQLHDLSLQSSYYNLFADYADVLPDSDQLLLLLHGLGGTEIPVVLLKSARLSQRRWNIHGEIESINAIDFGLPKGVVECLSDETVFSSVAASPYIIKQVLEDDTVAWSLRPEFSLFLSQALTPEAMEELGSIALKLLCFACPPCYEGNTDWSIPLKDAVWMVLDNAIQMQKVQSSDRSQVLEAILYFAERDSVSTRHAAMERAKALVRKPMSYYLQASVVLFQSILCRIDGDTVKSEAQIRNFMWRGPQPATRRDHALRGRLHISQIENKIKCFDNDVPSFIYKWRAELPLSTLDTEVTFRLQSTAARFFQSIGDFGAARASLEQFMALSSPKPIRDISRRLLVGRLADMYCEMEDYAKALEILQPELDSAVGPGRSRRDFRRLLLASVESNIGLGRLDAAQSLLNELRNHEPRELDNIHDQQLHMRIVLAAARIVHLGSDREEAVHQWMFALWEVQNMNILNSTAGFTAAMIYLSLAHAQLTTGDRYGGQQSWESGSEILKHERCEFWLSVVPTVWLQKIAQEVHAMEGWSVNMMLPGGTRTVTRP